jgi:protein TonB
VRHPGVAHEKGRVLLLVLIDAFGKVDDVNVVESEAPAHLDEDARQALKAARFNPARRNGAPVKSRLLVEIDYAARERAQ